MIRKENYRIATQDTSTQARYPAAWPVGIPTIGLQYSYEAEGARARQRGDKEGSCPHGPGSFARDHWTAGWLEADAGNAEGVFARYYDWRLKRPDEMPHSDWADADRELVAIDRDAFGFIRILAGYLALLCIVAGLAAWAIVEIATWLYRVTTMG